MPERGTIWEVLFGEERGFAVRQALTLLSAANISVEEVDLAIVQIGRETTLGPLLDPSAYVDGRRFDNAHDYAEMLRAIRGVIRCLAAAQARSRETHR